MRAGQFSALAICVVYPHCVHIGRLCVSMGVCCCDVDWLGVCRNLHDSPLVHVPHCHFLHASVDMVMDGVCACVCLNQHVAPLVHVPVVHFRQGSVGAALAVFVLLCAKRQDSPLLQWPFVQSLQCSAGLSVELELDMLDCGAFGVFV